MGKEVKKKVDQLPDVYRRYTGKYVDIFRLVFDHYRREYKLDIPDFNFQAGAEINFKMFQNLHKVLKQDIVNYYIRKFNRPPEEEEFFESVSGYFDRAYQYQFHWYSKGVTDCLNFTPQSIYHNYNKILQFKAPKQQKSWYEE